MIKYINGLKYDTSKAERVASWAEGYTSNFGYIREELYKKRNGTFFLYGEGGPASKYAATMGEYKRSFGENIIPFSNEDALERLKEHVPEKVEEIFGKEKKQKGEKETFCIQLRNAESEKLRRLAKERHMPMSSVIAELIKNA